MALIIIAAMAAVPVLTLYLPLQPRNGISNNKAQMTQNIVKL